VGKAKDTEIIVNFVESQIDKNALDRLPNLKYIATMSTGFDHIDIKECKKRKIKVSNVPFYGENTVAEHAFGLMLNLSRKIHRAIWQTRKKDFSLNGLEGFDLKDKTLGVIGPGSIGQNVIRIAKGFRMNVIASSPHKDKGTAKKLGFKYVSLDKLLKDSDIISINCPLNKKTHHMINMKTIKKIKKGGYLINTARGGIVDNTALLYGLDKKILAGAGLDVLEGEEDIKEEKQLIKKKMSREEKKCLSEIHKLLDKRNVIITPHSAFYSKEALQRIMDSTLENIQGFLKGRVKNKIV
jgi:D-lactate dehydrogenase